MSQIFRKKMPHTIIDDISKCFGIEPKINHSFNKSMLYNRDTINKIIILVPVLKIYYYKCKYHYLDDIDIKKCITILRHSLREKKINVISTIIIRNKIKYINYTLQNNKKIVIITGSHIIEFD
jgi:hypothetical protein